MNDTDETSKVVVDIKKNRLYITLGGTVRKGGLEKIYEDIQLGVQGLESGFDVITDLRQCNVGHLAGIVTFKKIMEYLSANGVNRTVRVVGKSKVLLKQISKITKSVDGYHPIYVSSFEEMEELLASRSK